MVVIDRDLRENLRVIHDNQWRCLKIAHMLGGSPVKAPYVVYCGWNVNSEKRAIVQCHPR
jgi:hypothetical protein